VKNVLGPLKKIKKKEKTEWEKQKMNGTAIIRAKTSKKEEHRVVFIKKNSNRVGYYTASASLLHSSQVGVFDRHFMKRSSCEIEKTILYKGLITTSTIFGCFNTSALKLAISFEIFLCSSHCQAIKLQRLQAQTFRAFILFLLSMLRFLTKYTFLPSFINISIF
jgi:hypothetical protein